MFLSFFLVCPTNHISAADAIHRSFFARATQQETMLFLISKQRWLSSTGTACFLSSFNEFNYMN